MATQFPTAEDVKGAGETVHFLFDFTPFPEFQAGQTIASASAPAVSGLTLGTPTLLAASADGIAAGRGVLLSVSGGTAGTTYTVSVLATFSGGPVREVRLSLTVR